MLDKGRTAIFEPSICYRVLCIKIIVQVECCGNCESAFSVRDKFSIAVVQRVSMICHRFMRV